MKNRDPYPLAGRAWASGQYPGEDAAPAHIRAWGAHTPLDALLTPPAPGEEIRGEGTRLGALAVRLWTPMLAAELVD
jgi:exodeoxyribonuclease V gamma subunit